MIWGEKQEVSHLCGDPRCINPEHLNVEHHDINQSRKPCQKDFMVGYITVETANLRVQSGTCVCGAEKRCLPRFVEFSWTVTTNEDLGLDQVDTDVQGADDDDDDFGDDPFADLDDEALALLN